jgi:dienelactone hydrolase
MPCRRLIALTVVALFASCFVGTDVRTARAQDAKPDTNSDAAWPPKIKRTLPPVAKPLPEKDAAALRKRWEPLQAKLDELRANVPTQFQASADAAILLKAVDYALLHNEFFDPKKDLPKAEALLKLAEERLNSIADDVDPLKDKKGILVRGFYSTIDGSPQPYGLIIPQGVDLAKPTPVYIWLHGRGDTQCDLQFISGFTGTKAPGPMQPANAIVLHPYGRYCNGFKSAGEKDVLEALNSVRKRYKIDESRIVLAGFSMGGAGAWHLGAHYAGGWCAVHAGAGFVDVKRYQNITPDKMPPSYVQKLWGLYDVPEYRRNLLNVPLIAYSGEDDKQKAAADIMEAELAKEGLKLTHLIGPGMGHKYHPEVLVEIQKRLDAIVKKGQQSLPKKVSLQTRTMRYPHMFWIRLLGMERQWDDTRIDAERTADNSYTITTKNVQAFRVAAGDWDSDRKMFDRPVTVVVDGQSLVAEMPQPALAVGLEKVAGKWNLVAWQELDHKYGKVRTAQPGAPLRKSEDVCGPIDDAFTHTFAAVHAQRQKEPSAIDRWVEFEAEHFSERWQMLMRGDHFSVPPSQTPPTDMNLVYWGTPKSNPHIAAMLDKLPIRWTDKVVGMGDLEFDATKVVPVLIYPNPANPAKYVVLNSGLTFREAHDRTNSQQNPKLPDWAFIDITQPPTDELPGKVLAAGFFDEEWKYQKQPAVDAKLPAK